MKTFRAMSIGQITAETVNQAATEAEIDTNKTNKDILAEMQKDDRSGSF